MSSKKISKRRLAEILKKHSDWLTYRDEGERADLRSADLRSADLSGADLRSADLRSAVLSGAVLRSAVLSGADLRSADLSGAVLRSAVLSGAVLRSAVLSGADLSGAVLSGADLSGADLRSADLSGADLSSAVLRSAVLSGADLPGGAHIISIVGIGSSRRMTTYWVEIDKIWCGCFTGTLDEFEKQVKSTHQNHSICLAEYLGAINYIKELVRLYNGKEE